MASRNNTVRDTVLKSLMAIGSSTEAGFFADLFQKQAPEKFAFIVVDPRCLKHPLIEALVSNFKILSDLDLTPIILLGAFESERTNVRFQAQRMCKHLESAGIKAGKLNCASYELLPGIRRIVNGGGFAVLEMTERSAGLGLNELVNALDPAKVIFLQPSGVIRSNGKRVPVINIDSLGKDVDLSSISEGQKRFINKVSMLSALAKRRRTYVMASPLNLLGELFTVKGSGTMLRRAASVKSMKTYKTFDQALLRGSIEDAFDKKLDGEFFQKPAVLICVEENYRAGAVITQLAGLPYLSKFWVAKEAQGEGIAKDIWAAMTEKVPVFFWRSRNENPFNDWYIKMCDGMQIRGEWRVFWKGLEAPEIPGAIIAAASAPHDFEYNNNNLKG